MKKHVAEEENGSDVPNIATYIMPEQDQAFVLKSKRNKKGSHAKKSQNEKVAQTDIQNMELFKKKHHTYQVTDSCRKTSSHKGDNDKCEGT